MNNKPRSDVIPCKQAVFHLLSGHLKFCVKCKEKSRKKRKCFLSFVVSFFAAFITYRKIIEKLQLLSVAFHIYYHWARGFVQGRSVPSHLVTAILKMLRGLE